MPGDNNSLSALVYEDEITKLLCCGQSVIHLPLRERHKLLGKVVQAAPAGGFPVGAGNMYGVIVPLTPGVPLPSGMPGSRIGTTSEDIAEVFEAMDVRVGALVWPLPGNVDTILVVVESRPPLAYGYVQPGLKSFDPRTWRTIRNRQFADMIAPIFEQYCSIHCLECLLLHDRCSNPSRSCKGNLLYRDWLH